jgi:hypothetical protein
MKKTGGLVLGAGQFALLLALTMTLPGCGEKRPPHSAQTPKSQQPKSGGGEPVFVSRPPTNEELQVVTQVTEAWKRGDISAAANIPPQLEKVPVFAALKTFATSQPSARSSDVPTQSQVQPNQPANGVAAGQFPAHPPPRVIADGRQMDLFEILISPDTPAQAVVPFLFAPDQATRWAAAGALELRGENVGVAELIKIVETDKDIRMVEKAAFALSAIGDYRGREVLRTLSESSNPTRAKIGRTSLETFGAGPTKSVNKLP